MIEAISKNSVENINESLIDLEKETKGFNYIFYLPFSKYTLKKRKRKTC